MAKIVIDLDATLTMPGSGGDYIDHPPYLEVIEALKKYHAEGFEISIYTARNMRKYENSVGKIAANTLPVIVNWLNKHDVPFDEIHIGKPWCGDDGFYVDDKAIRPDEFARLSYEEIRKLISNNDAT